METKKEDVIGMSVVVGSVFLLMGMLVLFTND